MGPNEAFRLAELLDMSINQRMMENINKGMDPNHGDRIQREKEALEKAKEKYKGHEC